jgi:hypothetical protein
VSLSPALRQAFHVAAGELGMASAAWLFVREVALSGGERRVAELRDLLGRDYPVLDAVVAAWQGGRRGPEIDLAPVLAACATANRLLVAGLETDFLDALVPKLSVRTVALLAHGDFATDWPRVASNYGGRVELVDVSSFQRMAGRDSVILTFVYGVHSDGTFVSPRWLRVNGADVRTQFRSIIAWDVLRAPMFVYPRWLVGVSLDHFSHVV